MNITYKSIHESNCWRGKFSSWGVVPEREIYSKWAHLTRTLNLKCSYIVRKLKIIPIKCAIGQDSLTIAIALNKYAWMSFSIFLSCNFFIFLNFNVFLLFQFDFNWQRLQTHTMNSLLKKLQIFPFFLIIPVQYFVQK